MGEQEGRPGSPGLPDPSSGQVPAPDGADEPKAKVRLSAGHRPVDDGSKVPVVAIESPHGRLPSRVEHPLTRGLRHADDFGSETRLDERALHGALEPLHCIFAKERMEAEP